MIASVVRVPTLGLVLLLASASAGASSTPAPPVALTASPSHLNLAGAGRATVRLTNAGTSNVVVDVTRAGFALDLRGRPKIVAASGQQRSAARWLSFRPRVVALKPHASAGVAVTARPPPHAEPGDHDALLLMTSRRQLEVGVAARMRLGVVVIVRTPGTVVRRLVLLGLRVSRAQRARRTLELELGNHGNVTETLARGRVAVSLERGGRRLARLTAGPSLLRPGTRGVLVLPLRRALVGPVVARVDLAFEGGRVRRVYRLRL